MYSTIWSAFSGDKACHLLFLSLQTKYRNAFHAKRKMIASKDFPFISSMAQVSSIVQVSTFLWVPHSCKSLCQMPFQKSLTENDGLWTPISLKQNLHMGSIAIPQEKRPAAVGSLSSTAIQEIRLCLGMLGAAQINLYQPTLDCLCLKASQVEEIENFPWFRVHFSTPSLTSTNW